MSYNAGKPKKISFPEFEWNQEGLPQKLYPRKKNEECFLISSDGYFQEAVDSDDDLPFGIIANINGLYFELNDGRLWQLRSYNPSIMVE